MLLREQIPAVVAVLDIIGYCKGRDEVSVKFGITGQPESIKKLTAEEQQEIRAYCENTERQAFDVGFKTAVQLWNQLDNTGGIMK